MTAMIAVVEHEDNGCINQIRLFQPNQESAAMHFACKVIEEYFNGDPSDEEWKYQAALEAIRKNKVWMGFSSAVTIMPAEINED